MTYDFELLRMQSFVACDTDVFFNVTITALVTFRSLVMVQHNHSSSRDDYTYFPTVYIYTVYTGQWTMMAVESVIHQHARIPTFLQILLTS